MEATNPKKKMIIMRGLPGSGKSYKAKKLAQAENGVIYSTDDFF
jgi:adenylate kinase family enzyme